VKVHPRQQPGRRSTDPADLPSHKTTYALRDIEHLRRIGVQHGEAIGLYVTAVLDTPLPWTKMRQAYRLLGLVRRFGAERVEDACARALEAETVDVGLISRMLERGGAPPIPLPGMGAVITTRFARDPAHFAVEHSDRRHPDANPILERPAQANTAAGSATEIVEEAR
jgi:hypothetical protein